MSIIPLEELFRRAIDVVESLEVPYLIYGGLALPAWGAIVTTEDVDLVVQIDEAGGPRLIAAFRSAGFALPPGVESTFTIDTWACASLRGRDVDLTWGATEFDRQAIARAVRVRLFDRTVPIASAEDLILYKLVAHRRTDLGHIEGIVVRQGRRLDLPYLREWAKRIAEATGRFEVPAVLEQILSEQGL